MPGGGGLTDDGRLAWWRERLRQAPPSPRLPADRPRPSAPSGLRRWHPLRVPPGGPPPLERLVAAAAALLHRWTGEVDVLVGAVTAAGALPVRADLSGDPAVPELLARVRVAVEEARAHAGVPWERLDVPPLPVLAAVDVAGDLPRADLAFEVRGACAGLHFDPDLFDAATAARLGTHLEMLLAGMGADPGRRLSELPLLGPAERRTIQAWNRTAAPFPADRCLHELFAAQAARTPDAIAVVAGSERLTYRELDARANQVGRWLRARGVGPDVPVGVLLERSPEMVVAIYGVLKAGGAYVPLDAAHPPRRLRAMLEATGAPVVVARRALLPALGGAPVRALCPDTDRAEVDAQPAGDPAGGARPDNLVYVIHTSGSTGQPKGVMNVHRALANRLHWMQRTYALTEADRVLQKTPTTFDVSVWELFWPLLTGARLVLLPPEAHRDAAELVRVIREEGVTTAHFVPAMLSVLLEEPGVEECRSLRRVICSGEALSVELQERFFDRLDAELHNLYGPTEAAIDVTAWACRREAGQRCVPIGRPIANTRIHLLDRRLDQAPIGVAAELFIAGAGLARGYLGRPDLTAERFLPDPYGEPGGRMYRSGDEARYLADGSIEFLGRLDHQVKLRGFRIELEEVQVALDAHPGVRESVVLLGEGPGGDARLVACLVPAGAAEPPAADLRAFLRERLPEHMVPAAFVAMDAFPLSASGKIDRRELRRALARGPAPADRLTEHRQAEALRQLLRARRRPDA